MALTSSRKIQSGKIKKNETRETNGSGGRIGATAGVVATDAVGAKAIFRADCCCCVARNDCTDARRDSLGMMESTRISSLPHKHLQCSSFRSLLRTPESIYINHCMYFAMTSLHTGVAITLSTAGKQHCIGQQLLTNWTLEFFWYGVFIGLNWWCIGGTFALV
jgi:hypothetical protein